MGPLQGYSAEIIGAEASYWLELRDKTKPFFLYVAFHEPHEPIATAKRYMDLYPAVKAEVVGAGGVWCDVNETFSNAVIDGNLVTTAPRVYPLIR